MGIMLSVLLPFASLPENCHVFVSESAASIAVTFSHLQFVVSIPIVDKFAKMESIKTSSQFHKLDLDQNRHATGTVPSPVCAKTAAVHRLDFEPRCLVK